MKLRYLLIVFLFFAGNLWSQKSPSSSNAHNIVPNPGFEQYSATPIGWFYKGQHFTKVIKYWSSATAASPDVFGPKVRVPTYWKEKGFGKAEEKTGNHG